MDSPWFRRLLTVLFAALLFVSTCVAQGAQQDEDDEDAKGSASVSVVLDKRGNPDVTLYFFQKLQDWPPVVAAASPAMHCPAANFAHPHTDPRTVHYAQRLPAQDRARYIASLEDANGMQMTAKCSGVMAHRGMIAMQSFDFTELTGVLRSLGGQQLTVSVNRPDMPSGDFSEPNQIALP